jgi:hypothetical protein
MTLSKDTRIQNMAEALTLMLGKLGDRALFREYFERDSPDFADIYPTTWKELTDRHMLIEHPWGTYQLTGHGWLMAVKITGQIESPEFRERLCRLNATLKGYIKGRRQEGLEFFEQVTAKANVPEDGLHNILESRIWESELNRTGAEFDDSKTAVIIPVDFGMEPL